MLGGPELVRLPRRQPRAVYTVCDAEQALGGEATGLDLDAIEHDELDAVGALDEERSALSASDVRMQAEGRLSADDRDRPQADRRDLALGRVLTGGLVFAAACALVVALGLTLLSLLGGESRRSRASAGVYRSRDGRAAARGGDARGIAHAAAAGSGTSAIRQGIGRQAADEAAAPGGAAHRIPAAVRPAQAKANAWRRSDRNPVRRLAWGGGQAAAPAFAEVSAAPAREPVGSPAGSGSLGVAVCGCRAAELEFGFER